MSVSDIKDQLLSAINAIDNKELLEAMLTIITLQATTPKLYILNDEQIKYLKKDKKIPEW